MNILVAVKREEKKLEKQLHKVQGQLAGLRTAAKALGHSPEGEVFTVKKRVLSEAGRAKIAAAARKRWAKVRKQAKKVKKVRK
jgi:membrane glycosyltransferase